MLLFNGHCLVLEHRREVYKEDGLGAGLGWLRVSCPAQECSFSGLLAKFFPWLVLPPWHHTGSVLNSQGGCSGNVPSQAVPSFTSGSSS